MRGLAIVLAGLLAIASASQDKKVVCYYASWAQRFDVSNIDATLCTHLIYSFVDFDKDVSRITDRDDLGKLKALRTTNPQIKLMMAVGGWNEQSSRFAKLAADSNLRKKFAENVVQFVKKYGFDGFDLDWEYPAQRDGSTPADKQNFVLLLKEMRKKFDQEGLILSAAVAATEGSASLSYDIPAISKLLDFINLMAYDLHGTWDFKTGIHAPTYGSDKLNDDAIISFWLGQGAPAEKLILGAPLYGRGFTLTDPKSNGIGATISGPSLPGPKSQEAGSLTYIEICDKIRKENWEVRYDEKQQVPYAFSKTQWIGYDNERSMTEKARLVIKRRLGGMMVWSLESDDFSDTCGGGKFPLLKAINKGLNKGGVAFLGLDALEQPSVPEPAPEKSGLGQPEPQPLPERPEVPDYPGLEQPGTQPSGLCQAEGLVSDPENCSNFYNCQAVHGSFIAHKFSCPDKLVFDVTTSICDYKEQVNCPK